MAFYVCLISATLLSLGAAAAGQQTKPAAHDDAPPTIVQPGAPGQNGKVLTPAAAAIKPRSPAEADVSFMQGMIMHHSQAVEMTELLRTRGSSKDLLEFGKRISISQSDEIKYMKQWLTDRGQSVEMQMDMGGMKMDAKDMKDMPMMPGMLTPKQMEALEKASGPAFDHLFLTGMIQHHTGALIMVKDLFDTPGAGQDAVLFDFATDVDNTQTAEIKIMQGMLSKEKQ